MQRALESRRFAFHGERAVYLTVIRPMFASEGDRPAVLPRTPPFHQQAPSQLIQRIGSV
jgi:hypothetical protein